jgi:hypothetical protein
VTDRGLLRSIGERRQILGFVKDSTRERIELARPRLAGEHGREPAPPTYPRPWKMHRSSSSKWGAAMMTTLDMALPVIA